MWSNTCRTIDDSPARSSRTLGSSASWAGVRLRAPSRPGNSPMMLARPNWATTGAPVRSNSTDESRMPPCATPTRCSSPIAETIGARAVTASPISIPVLRAISRARLPTPRLPAPRLPAPSRGRMRHGRPSAAVARSRSSSRWRHDARASASISISMLWADVDRLNSLIAAVRSCSGGSVAPA